MKLEIVDWGDDAYRETKKKTGTASSLVVARVEIPEFKGFSYDGGRLGIVGHPDTIWVLSNQWSMNIVTEWTDEETE